MSDVALFLGFPIDDEFSNHLNGVDPKILKIFIRSDTSDYLRELEHRGQRFIGKEVGPISDINILPLLQTNIYSLLKKIVPSYPCENIALTLFPFFIPSPNL